MGQCEKILDNGERCSNRAVPGTKACKTHARITFRPVRESADTTSLAVGQKPSPDLEESEKPEPDASLSDSDQKAVPSPAGQKPHFPGLQTDERDILVAPRGLIWLKPVQAETSQTRFGRMVRAMSLLSQAMTLPGQIQLMHQKEAGPVLIFIEPAQKNKSSLSVIYDAASSAARLARAGFYIGQDNTFVQYRDDRSPRGYDAPNFKPASPKEDILVVTRQGIHTLALADFTEIPLTDFCLQVAPVPHIPGPRPECLYALSPPPLYPMLARYLQAHHLCFGLARVQEQNRELILFEIRARANAPAGQTVPRFILDYLSRFPRVALLTSQTDDRQILLHRGHRYPLDIFHIAEAFDPDEMVLLIADHYPNLRISPKPRFFDGDRLTENCMPGLSSLKLAPRPADSTPRLKLPVLMRPDNDSAPWVAALVLSNQEMKWAGRLLYRAPEDAFAAYSLCQGEDCSVLLGNHLPIEGLPFGTPLRRIGDTRLFIPLRSRLWPQIPWDVLAQALEMQENTYTFLTNDYRLDLPESDFAPLSRAVVADPDRPQIRFNFRTAAALPELQWPSSSAEAPSQVQKQEKDISSKFKNFFAGETREKVRENSQNQIKLSEKRNESNMISLQDQARACEEAKDFLGAALTYSILKDTVSSARCYRQATELLSASGFPPPRLSVTPGQRKTEEME